ncbi:MAG TPA: MarR family winged helix-turn-helix transcriptional regulator [Acidimicrobiales bacterium]|nr:MarR family winged helix-turn-helix transcriptional regulator [Acidimicrobiales bacterium]
MAISADRPDEAEPAASAGLSPERPDRITLVGLVLESALGLRRALGPGHDCEVGIRGQSFEILLRLLRTPGTRLRMSDLAAQTGLTPSGLTRAVDRLVDAGLVARELCLSDRRGAFALLTEAGAGRAAEAVAHHECDIDNLLTGLYCPAEEEELALLLRRLRDRVAPEATLVSEPAPETPEEVKAPADPH